MIEPGSEFREKNKLETLFQHHEHWKKMESIISTGLDYPLTDLPEKVLKEDVIAMIARGNHKSATAPEVAPTLLKNYTKEVEHGWMLPVTLESVAKIKGAGVIPIGVAQQQTIDKRGNRHTKFRTTHDASFHHLLNNQSTTDYSHHYCLHAFTDTASSASFTSYTRCV